MEIPVASITDDREHMIMRAICDERISLSCEALALVPDLFNQHEEFDRHSPRMFCQIAWDLQVGYLSIPQSQIGLIVRKQCCQKLVIVKRSIWNRGDDAVFW